MPIYFKSVDKDKPTGLQGGVIIGYISDAKNKFTSFKDVFDAQLLVSAPLSVFGDLFK